MLIPANLKARQVEMQLGKGYKASAERVQTELEPVVTSGQQAKLNLREKQNANFFCIRGMICKHEVRRPNLFVTGIHESITWLHCDLDLLNLKSSVMDEITYRQRSLNTAIRGQI